ncbi:hypothetical protein MAR_020145 [Mya arenaria]|uniref:Uncharacterized protein n=1 Tax=Mya arenaria TaxID=6604 RepID=A0ABY7E764_MYAAR|nr:hypothetical protein MAR_020145 [Mya arenaria]
MDGAVCNRSFMHLCVGENSYLNYKFFSPNPTSSQDVILTMDVSHVLKKIRNNIMKSGLTAKSTRHLTLPDEPQLKMRNHLAEEVKKVKQTLNGAVQLLENTSKIVSIFRDMRQIVTLDDPRLNTLHAVSEWFLEWEKFAHEQKSNTKKPNLKMLMSLECHEDIQACIQGFILLCKFVLKMSSTIHVTLGLINSDVIENVFYQQRFTYNGANTNPNALQYRKLL